MLKLKEETIKQIEQLRTDGCSYTEIQKIILDEHNELITLDTVRHHATRKHTRNIKQVDKFKEQGIEKGLIISDLHIPFEREDVSNVIDIYKNEVSFVILGGDIVDCHAISSFDPLSALPLIDEMKATHKFLKELQDKMPDIPKYLIYGNHEKRFEKYMAKHQNELNNLHSCNILQEIVKGFECHNHREGKKEIYLPLDYIVIDNWYMQYYDMIVCHPTTFSRVAGKTSEMSLDYFNERGLDFNCCLVAYTHKQSYCMKYDKHAFEIGCLCKPQGYASSGKLTYTQQQNGYHIAVFKDQKYQVNESRTYNLK